MSRTMLKSPGAVGTSAVFIAVAVAGCGPEFEDNHPIDVPASQLPKQNWSPQATDRNAAEEHPVKLSVGTCLPVSLPDGTSMAFSVDYQCVNFERAADQKTIWVIEGNSSRPFVTEVVLQDRGELSILTPFRPEDGPFLSSLAELMDDQSRRTISSSINMR